MSDNKTSQAVEEFETGIILDHEKMRSIAQKYKKMEEALEYAKGDRHPDHCDDVNNGICNCKIGEINEAFNFDPLDDDDHGDCKLSPDSGCSHPSHPQI